MSNLGPVQWNTRFTLNLVSDSGITSAPLRSPPPLDEVVRNDIDKVSQQTGICADHLLELQCIARRHGCVIAFRPVDPHNSQLIEMGYPTKGLAIKGKSSTVGPIFGFIPVDQKLSGKCGTSLADVEKNNKKIEDCIAKGHAIKVPLELPPARMDYLLEKQLVRPTQPPAYVSLRKDGSYFHFTAEKNEEGNYRIATEGRAVEVLAPKAQPRNQPVRPFTADYDLLFLMPQWRDVTQQSKRHSSIKPAGPSEHPGQLGTAHIRSKYENPTTQASPDAQTDVDYVSTLEERVIRDINQSLRGELLKGLQVEDSSAWNLVHHGSDEGNPNTDTPSNFPATIIAPEALGGFGTMAVIPDKRELNDFLQEARNCPTGYMLVGNRAWFDESLRTNVANRGEEIMRKLSSQSTLDLPSISRRGSEVSSESSRRGSHISESDIAVLKAAADRRKTQSTAMADRRE